MRDDVSRPKPEDVTEILNRFADGQEQALEELLPLVYDELRRLARGHLRRERPDHTLQPTALVNEAYLRLADQHSVRWKNREHFFGIASRLMRRILVDHARKKRAEKRGGGATLIEFEEQKGTPGEPRDVIALDEALTAFAELDPRASRLVELRAFGGLELAEAARVLSVSPATAKRDWSAAKAWLKREMTR